jgi:hypothetical protein
VVDDNRRRGPALLLSGQGKRDADLFNAGCCQLHARESDEGI